MLQSYFSAISKKHTTNHCSTGLCWFCLAAGLLIGSVTTSSSRSAIFLLLFLTGTAHHDSQSVPLRSTTHNYFFAKFHTGKRRPDSGWVTSVVCQQVATLLIGHLPLIWIISYQGAAPAGQRMGNVSCSQGYLQRPGSCSKESLKRSTRKGKLEGMQGKNRGKEPISDLSITDVTNENLVHRVLGKKE